MCVHENIVTSQSESSHLTQSNASCPESAFSCHPSQLVTVVPHGLMDGLGGPSTPAGTRSTKEKAHDHAAAHPSMELHLRINAA